MDDFSSESIWKSTNFVDETFRGYYGWKEPLSVLRYDVAVDQVEEAEDVRKICIKQYFLGASCMQKLVHIHIASCACSLTYFEYTHLHHCPHLLVWAGANNPPPHKKK